MGSNPYRTLGVDLEADDDTIARAYRRAAKRTHPDVGGSAEDFQRVQEAYACLSDPFRRDLFDRTARGATAAEPRPRPTAERERFPWEGPSSTAASSRHSGEHQQRYESFSSEERPSFMNLRTWFPGITARKAAVVALISMLVALAWTLLDGLAIEGLEGSFLGQMKKLVVHTPPFSLFLFLLYAVLAVALGLRFYFSDARDRPTRIAILVGAAILLPWAAPVWLFLIFIGGVLAVLIKMLSNDGEE